MDLSAYIAISVTLNKVTGNVIIQDTSHYPAGVTPTIQGCVLSILQPDGVSVGNSNFSSPDIAWTGSGLNLAFYELRLNTAMTFQSGVYQITYAVIAPGYNETTLIKTFTLNYTPPIAVINSNFDTFTPNLSVSDGTVYAISGLNLVSVNDTWAVTVNSVLGTPTAIGGTGSSFSLAVAGKYYDANYSVSLTALVSWTLAGLSNFVTIVDQLQIVNQSFDAQAPPSTTVLLNELAALSAQVDAAGMNCSTYTSLLGSFLYAQATYQLFLALGCVSEFAGLDAYVLKLQKIFNNNVTPPIVHTNTAIPNYVFPCSGGGGSTSWGAITGKPSTVFINWTVGVTVGLPGPGANVLTDARLAGYQVFIMRNYILYANYTKNLADGFITFGDNFSQGEYISVEILAL